MEQIIMELMVVNHQRMEVDPEVVVEVFMEVL
jgi:hypothetical protein